MQPYYLLRHALSAPDPALPEPDWPLHEQGVVQAQALIPLLQELGPDRLFTSPYARAHATIAPFATAAGLEISVLPDLRERCLSPAVLPDWREKLALSWLDPELALPGGESLNQCRQRMLACIKAQLERHRDQTLIFASHGNAIAAVLGSVRSFGFDDWAAMPNPALYRIQGGSYDVVALT